MPALTVINAVLRLTFRPLWTILDVGPMRRVFALAERLGTLVRRMPALECDAIDSVHVEWIGERAAASHGMLVFVHGGAFAVRGARSDRLLCADLSRRTGLPVALLAYRLAPECPFPAALDDCGHLYRALLARGIAAGRMVWVGHSAGANLIAAMLMRVRDAGLAQPAGAVLLSGVFDLTGPSPATLDMQSRDVCATTDIWPWTRRYYLDGTDPACAGVSPYFGAWHALAPLHFHVSDSELLFDSVTATAARARAAGTDVALTIWPGLPHFYPALDMLAAARQCRAQIASFALGALAADAGAATGEPVRPDPA